MKALLTTIALVCSTTAHACKDNFHFEKDKQIHFAGSVVMGAAFNAFTDDPWKATAASVAVGAGIELLPKITKTGCASWQDFGYDVAGSIIGGFGGHWIKGLVITPRKVTYTLNANFF